MEISLLSVYGVSGIIWGFLLVRHVANKKKHRKIDIYSYYASIVFSPLVIVFLIPVIIFNFVKNKFFKKKIVVKKSVNDDIEEIIKNGKV